MRSWLMIAVALPLAAQQAAQEPAPPPTPAASEPVVSGSLDLGYRWHSTIGGNFQSYRTLVNLGEGPKLFGLDLTLQSGTQRWFDRIDVRANDWGGEPDNTAHVDASRHDWYDFRLDYRNIAYFNFLPSFADPTIGRGIFLDQRSFDTHRRMIDTELDLRPGKWIVPYLGYSHDSGFGGGITDFVSDSNEYPVANHLRDKTDNYRGGVRIEGQRFHLTLEQGGSTFKDDQQVFTSDQNFGNRLTPFLGEQLDLTSLTQAYGVRGDSIYSKVLATASPTTWMDLYGQFLYSRPSTDMHYAQLDTGTFVDLSTLLFFNGELGLLTAAAKQPHTSGSFGFELRPVRRLRVIESWLTDRLHNASSAGLTSQILTPAMAAQAADFADRLVWNYNQQQIDVLFDLTSKITLRGGHRYVWGDAETRGAFVSGLPSESGQLSRQVGLAGLNYRVRQNLSLNVDFEGASGDRAYFRTSLQDYQKARVRARYQPLTSLTVSAVFSVLNNQNPTPTVNYDFLSRDSSLAVVWSPKGGKRISLTGEYTRATLRSDLTYLVPQTLDSSRSFYRDNAHLGSALVDIAMPAVSGMAPRLSLGGSYFVSSGSRPTGYYQPIVRFTAPLHRRVACYGEWRWYGYSEPFYSYEAFRGHLLTAGLRLTR